MCINNHRRLKSKSKIINISTKVKENNAQNRPRWHILPPVCDKCDIKRHMPPSAMLYIYNNIGKFLIGGMKFETIYGGKLMQGIMNRLARSKS
jgi:hypothetical protein